MRSLFIKGINPGLFRSSTKGRKGRSPNRWPSLSGALQNLHLMSSFLALLSKKIHSKLPLREWPSTTCCLFLSGERRQGTDDNHDCPNKTHPEQLYPAILAKRHCGSAESRPHPTSLLRIPRKTMYGPCLGNQWKHSQGVEKCDLRHRLSCLKRLQIIKNAGSELHGPSRRLHSAGVCVVGKFF